MSRNTSGSTKSSKSLKYHLIKDITTNLCTSQPQTPEDIKAFITEQLRQRKQKGEKYAFYNVIELTNVFSLFDLKSEGTISKD